jgi:hypothetical protein
MMVNKALTYLTLDTYRIEGNWFEMSAITEKLEALIVNCLSRIDETKQMLIRLEGELLGYENARSSILESVKSRKRADETSVRSLSESWRKILAFIGTKNENGASLDEISEFSTVNQLNVSRESVRSQLTNYINKEIVERIGTGQYKLTAGGYDVLRPIPVQRHGE